MEKTRPTKKARYWMFFLTICLILVNFLFASAGVNLLERTTWNKVVETTTNVVENAVQAVTTGSSPEYTQTAGTEAMAANYTNLSLKVLSTTQSDCSQSGTIRVQVMDGNTPLTDAEMGSLTAITFVVEGYNNGAPVSITQGIVGSKSTFTLNEMASGTYTKITLNYTYNTTAYTAVTTGNITVLGNYVAPTVTLVEIIPSFSCRAAGRITVKIADGTPNYKLELIPTGTSTYKDSIKNITTITDGYTFDNVPMGTYKVKVTDNCNSSAEIANVNVVQTGYMEDGVFVPSNYPQTITEQPYFLSWNSQNNLLNGVASNCQKVVSWIPTWVGAEHSIHYFWWDGLSKYWQHSALTSNPNPANVSTWTSFADWNAKGYLEGTLQSANYQIARENDEKLYLHVRMIDANGQPIDGCPIRTETLHFAHNGYYNQYLNKREGGLYYPYTMPYLFDASCNLTGVRFGYPGETHTYDWIVCYPYKIYVYEEGSSMEGEYNASVATDGTPTTLSGVSGGLAFYQGNVQNADYINITGTYILPGHTYYYKMIDAVGATLLGSFTMPEETRVHSPQNYGVYGHVSCSETGHAMWVGSTKYHEDEGWWDLWEGVALPIGTKVKMLSYPAGVPSDWVAKITANNTVTITSLDEPVVSVFDWEAHAGRAWMEAHMDFPEGEYTVVVFDPDPCIVPDTITYTQRNASYSFGAPTVHKSCYGLVVTLPEITGMLPDYRPTLRGETTGPNIPEMAESIYYSLTAVKDKNGNEIDNGNWLDSESRTPLHFARSGQTVLLPAPGRYEISPTTDPDRPCPAENPMVIDFPDTRLELDAPRTYAYGCMDGVGQGIVSVVALHGQGKIRYKIVNSTPYEGPFPDAISGATGSTKAAIFSVGTVGTTYIVEAIDSCNTRLEVPVTAAPFSAGGFISTEGNTTVFCAGDDITLSSTAFPSEGITYSWYKVNGTEVLKQSGTNPNFTIVAATPADAGTYRVRTSVVDGSCYGGLSADITITVGNTCLNARNDYRIARKGVPINIDELLNDSLGTCNRNNIEVIITQLPFHGNVVQNGDKTFTYTSADYVGMDSLKYRIKCGTQVDEAWVIITIYNFPDNIVLSDECNIKKTGTPWTIQERYTSSTATADQFFYTETPLVGDVDGDNDIEIITAGQWTVNNAYDIANGGVYVFNGKDGTLKRKIATVPYRGSAGTRALAKVREGQSAQLFLACSRGSGANNTGNYGYLFCYDMLTGTQLWRSNQKFLSTTNASDASGLYALPHILIADVNADGIPEVIVGKRIFNAVNGDLLLDMETTYPNMTFGFHSGHSPIGSFPSVADMDNDGILEFVAGNNIYKLNIAPNTYNTIQGTSNISGNSCSLLLSSPTHTYALDGATAVADLNNDGYLDVVVSRSGSTGAPWSTNGDPYLYAWDGKTGEFILEPMILGPSVRYGYGPSIPFIGDIDGDNYPEVCVIASTTLSNTGGFAIHTFKYDPASPSNSTTKLKRFWTVGNYDESGATGVTLFDFNQDGKMEMVYRDQQWLRILDGATGKTLDSLRSNSMTLNEYPVVADVTGDGRANIVVMQQVSKYGTANGWGGSYTQQSGVLQVFESKPEAPWAPARPVWNQWAYNVVNVNKDLTIPRYQFNPATLLNGGAGCIKRPYNAFLQQQTIIDQNGCLVWPRPNIIWEVNPTITVNGTTVTVTGTVKNIGKATLLAPIYITFYKNDTAKVNMFNNFLKLDSIKTQIAPDSSYAFTFTLTNVPVDASKIWFSFNDKYVKGATAILSTSNYPVQTICMVDDRIAINLQPTLIDHAQALACLIPDGSVALTTNINVLAKGVVTCANANQTTVAIKTAPKHGQIGTLANNIIPYTPNKNYIGFDTIIYEVKCNNVSLGEVQMIITVVPCPDNIEVVDCFGEVSAFDWNITKAFGTDTTAANQIATEMQIYVGDLNGDGFAEMVAFRGQYSNNNASAQSHRNYEGIRIFDHKGALLNTIINHTDGKILASCDGTGVMGLVKLSDGTGLIVVADANLYLYAFDLNGNQKWKSSDPYGVNKFVNIGFTDFNHDGHPEIHVFNKVFDAETGLLLAEATEGNSRARALTHFSNAAPFTNTTTGYSDYYGSHQMVADVLGTGTPQLILGNEIHEVNIISRTNASQNSIHLVKKAPSIPAMGSYSVDGDGHVGLADFDLDGNLDVLISTRTQAMATGGQTAQYLYLWNPTKNTVSPAIRVTAKSGSGKNIPMIGDIDGDGKPEVIILAGTSTLVAYRYDGVGNQFTSKWTLSGLDDKSASTGLTMFDFNQDGKMELVYRDEYNLRIFDGSADNVAPTVLSTILCGSTTASEYPVIADIDDDGHAEIIVTGHPRKQGEGVATYGEIMVFKGATHPWAPARPVWNQYSYNAVNVNKNLTIPKYQFNPATAFAGACSAALPINPHRPYNGFLVQQTILNQEGCPLWLAPKVEWVGSPMLSAVVGDSVIFTGTIKNTGNAGLIAPIYITAYKNSVAAGNVVKLDSIQTSLNTGDQMQIRFVIKNISKLTNVTKLIFNVNDKQTGTLVQPQCNVMATKEMQMPSDCWITGRLLFKEDFGTGGYATDPLPAGITSYVFKNEDLDGHYHVTSYSVAHVDKWYTWSNGPALDHTNPGAYQGRMMIVNADYNPGQFYKLEINNLCADTKLYFSAWVFNLMNPNGSYFTGGGNINNYSDPNLTFILTDKVSGSTLTTYNTGPISKVDMSKGEVNWRKYGFEFTTATSDAVVLTIINNNLGGNGNDLMLDDIEVRLCVPPVQMPNDTTVCIGEPYILKATVANDGSFSTADNVRANIEYKATAAGTWAKIAQVTPTISGDNATLLIDYTINSIAAANSGYYRVVVSNATNIDADNVCRSISDSIQFTAKNCLITDYTSVLDCIPETEIPTVDLECPNYPIPMKAGANGILSTITITQQPLHGTARTIQANGTIGYKPAAGFTGRDTIRYTLVCPSDASVSKTVILVVNVIPCPDNITDANCVGEPQQNPWGIQLRYNVRNGSGIADADYITEMDVPLVGDLSGNGDVKILAASALLANSWMSNKIHVFDGKTGALDATFTVVPFRTMFASRAIAKVNGKTLLYVFSGGETKSGIGTPDHKLHCYEFNFDGNGKVTGVTERLTGGWTNADVLSNITGTGMRNTKSNYSGANIMVADINGDGRPEVFIFEKIFDAETGALLLDMNLRAQGRDYGFGAGHSEGDLTPYFPVLADMDNDGTLELVAGRNIYKINIPANATDASGSSYTIAKTATGNQTNVDDGFTAVADLNGDGYLDVIVTRNSVSKTATRKAWDNSSPNNTGDPYLYAWNGKTGELFGNAVLVNNSPKTPWGLGPSIPFIGDITGNGTPDICVSTTMNLNAFKYDSATKSLQKITTYGTSDGSGATTLSLFDFDQDGAVELVYRDQDSLRILKLQSNNTFKTIAKYLCRSMTQNEYPVIADVTGDGQANIVVFGSTTAADADAGRGYVYVYEAPSHTRWAPARKVWNQWAYNVVNVNKDLTIPKVQLNPATVFDGGVCGTVRPYNAFLKQQTLLNDMGCPIWILPNIIWEVQPTIAYDAIGDSVTFTGTLKNIGDASMSKPIYVTIYKDDTITANIIKLDSINGSLLPGQSLPFSLTVKNIKSYAPISKLYIGVNDKNNVYPYQQECMVEARVGINFYTDCDEEAFTDDVWYFGGYATSAAGYDTPDPNATSPGIIFRKDGNGDYHPYDASGISKVRTFENSLVVASPYCNGQVIFYMQHDQLFNRQNEVMDNGSIQGHYSTSDGLAACYMFDNKYLVFAVTENYMAGTAIGLNAHVVNMNADNGQGSRISTTVIETPSGIGGDNGMSEVIELIPRKGTSNQYFLVYRINTNVVSRLVTVDPALPNGFSVGNVVSTAAVHSIKFNYALRASYQFDKLALFSAGVNLQGASAGVLDVYDFDNDNGTISNNRTLNGFTGMIGTAYGLCFAPDGKSVYVSGYMGTAPIAKLGQYEITATAILRKSVNNMVQYWSTGCTVEKGGGMKLGPDGKIYVARACSDYVGIINNPNSMADDLNTRYVMDGFQLSKKTGAYLEFSTGLTKPAIRLCNENTAPVANPDAANICNKNGASVSINVLRNDTDAENDNIFLTGAHFVNDADTAKATIVVNPTDSTVTVTLKNGVILTAGQQIIVAYDIKDDGTIASKCSSGILTLTAEKCIEAIDDNATTERDTKKDIPVLDNDDLGDCNKTNVGLTVVQDPKHGTAIVKTDGSGNKYIEYTPTTGYVGKDTLRYEITCNGQKDTAFVYIDVTCPAVVPSVSISGNNISCAGTAVVFTAIPVNGGATPSYQWKKNGNNVGTNSVTYSPSDLITGDVITVVMTSSDACANPATATSTGITMTVNPVTTTMTGPASVCENAEEIFSVPAGSNYTWSITPSGNGSFVGSTGTNIVMVKLTGAATVAVSYTLNGCTVTASKAVTMNPSATATITGSQAPCVGATIRYETAQGKTDYIWTIPGSYVIINGGLNQYYIEVKWTAPVSDNIVVNYNGTCAAPSDPYPVTVSNANITATFTGDATACPGIPTTLQFNVSGGTAPYTVTYEINTPSCGKQTKTVTVNSNPYTINVPGSAEGSTYTIIKIVDANGCISTSSATADVILCNTPDAKFKLGRTDYCLGDQVQLSIEFSEVITTGSWVVTYSDGKTNHTITIDASDLEADGKTYNFPLFTLKVDTPMKYELIRIVNPCGCPNKKFVPSPR